jgi:hypothetical protein
LQRKYKEIPVIHSGVNPTASDCRFYYYNVSVVFSRLELKKIFLFSKRTRLLVALNNFTALALELMIVGSILHAIKCLKMTDDGGRLKLDKYFTVIGFFTSI